MKKDNACWAEPCEGCVPLARNSRDYTCTCGIKSSDLSCNTCKYLYSNSSEINTESKFDINSVTEFDEKHTDYFKVKIHSYCTTCERYEFMKKLTEFGYRTNAKFRFGVKLGRITIKHNY